MKSSAVLGIDYSSLEMRALAHAEQAARMSTLPYGYTRCDLATRREELCDGYNWHPLPKDRSADWDQTYAREYLRILAIGMVKICTKELLQETIFQPLAEIVKNGQMGTLKAGSATGQESGVKAFAHSLNEQPWHKGGKIDRRSQAATKR